MWNRNVINPFIKGPLDSEEKAHLTEYWKNLIDK